MARPAGRLGSRSRESDPLLVRGGTVNEVARQITGWFGQQNPFSFDSEVLEPAADARRFQTGTPAIPSAYAANAGLRALCSVPQGLVDQRVRELVDEADQTLREDGEQLWSPTDPDLRGPMVALVDDSPEQLAGFLEDRRIHASPRGNVLRLSFHGYNERRDVEAVCQAIRNYRKS